MPIRSLEQYTLPLSTTATTSSVGQGDGDIEGRRRARPGTAGGQGPGKGRRPASSPGVDYYEAEITRRRAGGADLRGPGPAEPRGEAASRRLESRDGALHRHPHAAASCPTSTSAARSARTSSATRAKGRAALRRRAPTTTCASRPGSSDDRARVERGGHRDDGRVGLDGRVREVHHAQLLLLDGALPAHASTSNVQIVFITHHTEAKEVDRGRVLQPAARAAARKVSSAYQLALRDRRAALSARAHWNIYPFHFSDGDNWGEGQRALRRAGAASCSSCCNLFGYGEIREGGRRSTSTLMSAFSRSTTRKFIGGDDRRQGRRLPGAAEVLRAARRRRRSSSCLSNDRRSSAELRSGDRARSGTSRGASG